MKDFQFLIDMAQMAIDVRRSLSYTYAIRFHLVGINKQVLFDHMLENMESSLEAN